MEAILGVLIFVAGAAAGYFAARRSSSAASADLGEALRERAVAERTLELEKRLSAEAAERKAVEERLRSNVEEIERTRKALEERFENLASQLLERSAESLRKTSETGLKALLDPLKERLVEFKGKVEEAYGTEAKERSALRAELKNELENIVKANQRISEEANNLARALKGDAKAQGDWGEIVLERILEASGLRPGEEYVVQGKELGLVDAEGKRMKPDVLVHLPEGKHIVVDSKVTLTAYERWASAADDAEKGRHLKDFHVSFYKHVDELGLKHYQGLEKIDAPDFVLMFVPIEAAFAAAMGTDPELFPYAWDRRVVVVSPATLFATLRTVAALWRTERQNRNALEIARQGGALYDKFVAFLGDLEDLGRALGAAQKAYDEAFGKLKDGRGNLIGWTEKLRQLGAKTSKRLDAKYLPEDAPTEQV